MIINSLDEIEIFNLGEASLNIGDIYIPADKTDIALEVRIDKKVYDIEYKDYMQNNNTYIQHIYEEAIEKHILEKVKSVGYSSITDATKYGVGATATRKAQSVYFADWIDAVWNFAEAQYALVGAGTIPMPTIQELLSSLPLADAIPSR